MWTPSSAVAMQSRAPHQRPRRVATRCLQCAALRNQLACMDEEKLRREEERAESGARMAQELAAAEHTVRVWLWCEQGPAAVLTQALLCHVAAPAFSATWARTAFERHSALITAIT